MGYSFVMFLFLGDVFLLLLQCTARLHWDNLGAAPSSSCYGILASRGRLVN